MLTIAGLITRIIGFGYRIFLSSVLGETRLGVYQLIFPVYSLAFTIYAAGIQTAVSQIISHESKEKHPGIVKGGIILSLALSVSLSALVFSQSTFISNHFLNVAQTKSLLRILAVVFPFCGVTAVINGYFYGINTAKIPAVSQIVEQFFRVGFVFGVFFFVTKNYISESIAVLGLLSGELAANVYNILKITQRISFKKLIHCKARIASVWLISLPLTSSRFIVSILGSAESIMIPLMLGKYGYSTIDALAIYGILSGVVLPFILFPGTLTNSLSVLLLPAISYAAGRSNMKKVRRATAITFRYSLLLGVVTSCVFLVFGKEIGTTIFHSVNAGKLLTITSFLCPFLYVSTTLGSIINGLGKTTVTLRNNVAGLSLRIVFLILVTPKHGIYGYLFGLMLSQTVTCVFDAMYLVKHVGLPLALTKHFVAPYIFCCCAMVLAKIAGRALTEQISTSYAVFTFLPIAMLVVIGYFLLFQLVNKKDFSKS